MQVIERKLELRELFSFLRQDGKKIGFVPTMGALHEGHLSLVKLAKEQNDVVIVSIYINPLQFGPTEDLAKYPRNLEYDLNLLEKEGVAVVFNPNDEEMYGRNVKCKMQISKFEEEEREDLTVVNPPFSLINCLCGKSRPGHFNGVATVVSKLFNIVQPHRAYFGQKDYQQSLIIKKLVQDLNFPIEVYIGPIIREEDSLAMSSRNVYLNKEERKSATVLYRALQKAEQLILTGFSAFINNLNNVLQVAEQIIKEEELVSLDYFEIRESETLRLVEDLRTVDKIVIAGAIKVGKTRLIDNIVVDLKAIGGKDKEEA